MDFLLLEGANIWDVYEKYYSDKINQHTYEVLAHCDPTSRGDNKGKYLPWIINTWISQPDAKNSYLESIAEHLHTILEWYDSHRTLLPQEQQDISHLSYEQLTDIYDNNKTKLFSKKELKQQYSIIYKDDVWTVYEPHTYEGERYVVWTLLGGASWCTAAGENGDRFNGREMFERYTRGNDVLHIFQNRQTNEIYQFSPANDEFRNRENEDASEGLDVDSMGLTNELVEWYENKYDINLYDAAQGEEDWEEDALYGTSGDFIGYFREGTLYNINKEEIEDYYGINTIGSKRIAMDNRNNTIDIININNGDLELVGVELRDYQVEDFYGMGYEHEIAIGIDQNNYFCVYPLDNDWDYDTGGIRCIKRELDDETWLLQWDNSENACDIVSLHNGDIMVYSGCYVDDEHMPYLDEDDYDTVYFWIMSQGELKKCKSSLSEGTDGDYEEVQDDIDDEEEYEEEPEEEMVQVENFKRNFWKNLNKLNEIHKRNSQLRLD